MKIHVSVSPKAKQIILLLAVFLLGVGLSFPAYLEGEKLYDRIQVAQYMNENTDLYAMVDRIEQQCPIFTVLQVEVEGTGDNSYVLAWLLYNTDLYEGMSTADANKWYLDQIKTVVTILREEYPDIATYSMILASYDRVTTVEGPKFVVRAWSYFGFTPEAVDRIVGTEECMNCLLSQLYAEGEFLFQDISYYGIFLNEILPREPGYTYPWEQSS